VRGKGSAPNQLKIRLSPRLALSHRRHDTGNLPKQIARNKEVCGSRTCKPNSVRRIAPTGRPFLWAAHCCAALATYPEVERTEPARVRNLRSELPPYLVLLRVGFALPIALLRRRCALTAPFHPYPAVVAMASRVLNEALTTTAGRYVFCGTFRRTDLTPFSRTLSGTLLCGVRTFLSLRPKTQEATVRSGCLDVHYMRWVRRSGFGL
jgi:hypothetical protein